MDNLAHDYPMNHRKRKADSEDCTDPAAVVTGDPLRPDPVAPPPTPCAGPSHAPRQPCLTSDTDDALWSPDAPSPRVSSPLSARTDLQEFSSPPHATKRPRLEKLRISTRRPSRRSPIKPSPAKSPAVRHGSDIEDIGIVPTADPGPSSGSLLRARATSFSDDTHARRPCPQHYIPFDLTTLPLPPPLPLINRQTLKELDLDAILRNPQLRHDLLFDPGLQFRPTGSRRKREMADKYWSAILQDVERGCTCMTFDSRRKPRPLVCICGICGESSPISGSVLQQVSPDRYTVRTPSRVPALLTEFLEILLLVIQPLCSISGIYVNPNTFKAQMQEHSTQAAYIRSIFDPVLIEQELRCNIFDPSGLFRTIGETLKGHCAPMRDRSVEAMMRVAGQCGAGSNDSATRDAIKAIQMCMEILEFMKLDIANHQLQTLRPFLLRTSGQFELRTLKGRHGLEPPMSTTRDWIKESHATMLCSQPIFHSLVPGKFLRYTGLSANQQLYLSVLRGIVNLVFSPPSTNSKPTATPANTPPATPMGPSISGTSIPETLYLDNTRVLLLSSDAADITTLYMFLLLYRQLVFSDEPNSSRGPPKLADVDLIKIKRELRDIAGNYRLGRFFSRNHDKNGKEDETWRVVREDIVLQVAKRAKDARTCRPSQPSPPSPSSILTSSTSWAQHSRIGDGLDERSLNIARKWVDTHIQTGSALGTMLHNRLRETVFNAVVLSAFPGRELSTGCRPVTLNFTTPGAPTNHGSAVGTATGMEPLANEIRTLTEKISLLALIHLNAYLPMYESEGFAPSQ